MEEVKVLYTDIGGMEAGKFLDRDEGGECIQTWKEMLCGKVNIESGDNLINKIRVLRTSTEREYTLLDLGL